MKRERKENNYSKRLTKRHNLMKKRRRRIGFAIRWILYPSIIQYLYFHFQSKNLTWNLETMF